MVQVNMIDWLHWTAETLFCTHRASIKVTVLVVGPREGTQMVLGEGFASSKTKSGNCGVKTKQRLTGLDRAGW